MLYRLIILESLIEGQEEKTEKEEPKEIEMKEINKVNDDKMEVENDENKEE